MSATNEIIQEPEQSVGRNPVRIWFRRRQIWLSEPAGLIFAALILFCLSIFGINALVCEHRIRKNERTISGLKAEYRILERSLQNLEEQERIVSTLEGFGRGRFSRQTIKLLTDLVHKNSCTYGYDPLLVLAVIYVESFFKTEAVGRFRSGNTSGAIGLMQIKYETALEVAEDLGISIEKPGDVFNPEVNITLGLGYLTRCISRFKSLKLGILAYNQGPDVIRKSLSGEIPLSEDYYRKVLASYFRLKQFRTTKTIAD
jgi:soluble lytic murein transglycosylase